MGLQPLRSLLRKLVVAIILVSASLRNDWKLELTEDYDITSRYEDKSFCLTEGSLHQLALDMFMHSSPPGTASYNKLKHVLDLNSEFYVEMGGVHGIFAQNEAVTSNMLYGYGLHPVGRKPSGPSNVTLVETRNNVYQLSLSTTRCQLQRSSSHIHSNRTVFKGSYPLVS